MRVESGEWRVECFTIHSPPFQFIIVHCLKGGLYKRMSEENTLLVSHTENSTELLGPYRRFVIWVHGCCFDCEGCLAENTKYGSYTAWKIQELAETIASCDVEGITVSGGEPFLQANALYAMLRQLQSLKEMGVIIYTGFTLEELRRKDDCNRLLSMTDLLIDGRYVRELDDGRAYIGSSNQRLHYLSDRYKTVGQVYYAAAKRRAEIKFTANQAVLIGVPSKGVLDVWQKIKEKAGGMSGDF